MFKYKLLKKLFTNQRFFWFGDSELRVKAYALQIKAIKGVVIAVREKSCLNTANMTFETSILALFGATTG